MDQIIEVSPHSYLLNNGKWYKYYELSLVDKADEPHIMNTRLKTNTPTREQLKWSNTINRRLNKEGIELYKILKTTRSRKPTDKFHY